VTSLLYEPDTLGAFLLVTVALGGAAAFVSGRTVAQTWQPRWRIVLAVLLLGGAERFIHYALFGGTLLSPYYYLIDSLIALGFGTAGFITTRVRQMRRQYGAILEHP
jgi:NO-binding membrane sensor protein with MHYT domain